MGRVVKEMFGDGWVATERDSLGRATAKKTSLGLTETIRRSEMGHVLAMSASGGWSAHFDRDGVGAEVRRQMPGGVDVRRTWDDAGRPAGIAIQRRRDDVLAEMTYTWGGLDVLRSKQDGVSGATEEYFHDARGRLAGSRYDDRRAIGVAPHGRPEPVGAPTVLFSRRALPAETVITNASIDPRAGAIDLGNGVRLTLHTSCEADFVSKCGGGYHATTQFHFASYRLDAPVALGEQLFSAVLYFEHGVFMSVSLALERAGDAASWTGWSESRELERKAAHDEILVGLLGPAPYRFAWGEISSHYDPRSGSSSLRLG